MRNRIVWRLVVSFVLLILVSVLIMNFFVSLKLNDYFETSVTARLRTNAGLLAMLLIHEIAGTGRPVQEVVSGLAASFESRVTVIGPDGRVLADSWHDPAGMENHAGRPEFMEAMKSGLGQDTRLSETLGYRMKYVAVAAGGTEGLSGVVRLALPLSEVESSVKQIYMTVLTGGLIAVAFVIIIGYFVSRGIIGPLSEMTDVARSVAQGDFSKRLRLRGGDELAILAASLNRMSDEIEQQIEKLHKAGRMKTELVANVSHELKTPLTSIIGYIETLEDGALEDGENARRFLSIIRRHAEGLSNTVDDLLQLSELEGIGRGSLLPEEFDLRQLIEDVMAGCGRAAAAKGISLRAEYASEGLRLHGDRLKLEQALLNLIDNAVKYTPGGGEVVVIARDIGESVEIRVNDTGVGISAEHLGRVFERFYRVDRARSRKLGGTGLGLAIVKHTVLLHGGSVKIDSEPGSGTFVTITLPKGV